MATAKSRRALKKHTKAKKQPLAVAAFDRLRAEIIRCNLPPGLEITEGSLCDAYGLSKAPVRAALLKLSQEGLVRAVPRHGYVIAPITVKNVQEMFDLRIVLEPAIARMAAGRADIELLTRLNVAPGSSKADQAELQFLKSNREFHLSIARATGNSRMVALMGQLLDEMARLLHLGLFSSDWRAGSMLAAHAEQAKQHEDLIDALARADADAAESAARLHIVESRDLVMKALANGQSRLDGQVSLVQELQFVGTA